MELTSNICFTIKKIKEDNIAAVDEYIKNKLEHEKDLDSNTIKTIIETIEVIFKISKIHKKMC